MGLLVYLDTKIKCRQDRLKDGYKYQHAGHVTLLISTKDMHA